VILASARAQKSSGYKEVGRWHHDRFVDGKWLDHILTELRREDWERSAGADRASSPGSARKARV
jgi:hypothetical protein